MTKDVISLSISVLLLFRHYISHKITFGAPSSGGVLCSACGAFILIKMKYILKNCLFTADIHRKSDIFILKAMHDLFQLRVAVIFTVTSVI